MISMLKLYGAGLLLCFGLDLIWLGVVARDFMQRQIGFLMRSDIQWVPGVAFYLIYVAALLVFVVSPGIERGSLSRVVVLGAFFGLAAYAAFDLTCLALFRDYPVKAALVDLAWGSFLTMTVSTALYLLAPVLR
jgi:uncharacterized membrane protein